VSVQIPQWLFSTMIWAAVGAVGAGALYLVLVLVREWRQGNLW
jgi:hypothetical protein